MLTAAEIHNAIAAGFRQDEHSDYESGECMEFAAALQQRLKAAAPEIETAIVNGWRDADPIYDGEDWEETMPIFSHAVLAVKTSTWEETFDYQGAGAIERWEAKFTDVQVDNGVTTCSFNWLHKDANPGAYAFPRLSVEHLERAERILAERLPTPFPAEPVTADVTSVTASLSRV